MIAVKPALQHENVTLLRNRMVWKLVTDASGRTVTEVHALHNGQTDCSFSAGSLGSLLRAAIARRPAVGHAHLGGMPVLAQESMAVVNQAF